MTPGIIRPIAIRTKNAKALQELFHSAENSLGPEDLKKVFLVGVQVIQRAALSNVRRLFKRKTGNLEKSIIAMGAKSANSSTAYTKAAYKAAPHAHLLEFGHKIVGRKIGGILPGRVGGTVLGRPFFRPAVDENKAAVKALINVQIKALLTMAFKPGHSPDDTGWIG